MPKFPVNFPVSREFGDRDRLESDCICHHAVLCKQRFPELTVNDRDVAGLRESGSVCAIDYRMGGFALICWS